MRRLRPTRLRLAAGALLVAAVLSACSSGAAGGTAFYAPGSVWIGAVAIPPRAEIGFLGDAFQNTSGGPVTIESVGLDGAGVGTVVRIVEVMMAPQNLARHSVPGALYVTDPPVSPGYGPNPPRCVVQALDPVHGYQVQAGGTIRFWVVFKALRPGRYRVRAHVLTYMQQGSDRRQVISLQLYGSVARGARYPVVSLEARCLDRTHLLNPGHSARG